MSTPASNLESESPSSRVDKQGICYQGKEQMTELFNQLNLKYIERVLYTKECFGYARLKKTDHSEYNADPAYYDEMTEKYGALVRSAYLAPVYVKWCSDEVGYGVFASEDIPAGSLIGEYAGVVALKRFVKNKTWSWRYPSRGDFEGKLKCDLSLDGGIYGNELRFINHSDDLNTCPIEVHDGTTWVNCYYASKDINKDHEVFVSYGENYWKDRAKIIL